MFLELDITDTGISVVGEMRSIVDYVYDLDLMEIGCRWEACRAAGQKASHAEER